MRTQCDIREQVARAARMAIGLCMLCGLTWLVQGCALIAMRDQAESVESVGIIEGAVKVESGQKGPVYVVRLVKKEDLFVIEDRVLLPANGRYRFKVYPGDYIVAAFIDVNRSGRFDPGEHGFYHPGPRIDSVGAKQTVVVPALTITGDPIPPPADIHSVEDLALYARNAGRIVSLSDPIFSPQNCSMGMWRSLDFLKEVGGGLFMLQPYRRDRMPVIFVHGIGGGPNDWKAAIEGLDRDRFQPWVLFYPSGLRLEMISDAFARQVEGLRQQYGFTRFGIAAHSMGGLVVRSFVKTLGEKFPADVGLLQFVVTVNSPMGGMAAAAAGVKHSPIVLPAWRDVATDSDFMKRMQAWPWPASVPYHLVFSYQTGDSSDGTIPLESQLPFEMQAAAVRLYGMHDTHVGTLSNAQFLRVFARILDGSRDAGGSSARPPR